MLGAAKRRAQKLGVPFDLSEDDIDIPATCPVLGMPLVQSTGRPTDASPSLDRLIPELGYVPHNIRVISYRANTLKRDATLDEFTALVRYMKERRDAVD